MRALAEPALAEIGAVGLIAGDAYPGEDAPDIAALASMYRTSDPYLLPALFSPGIAPAHAAPVATVPQPATADFSTYVLLHITRDESAPSLSEAD